MNAIKLLEWQHDEVDTLFAQHEKAEGPEEKLETFNALADALTAHAIIEEKLFYPAVYTGELRDQLTDAMEEHQRARRVLADLRELEPEEPGFEAKVKQLQEEVDAHLNEEEDELFPIVKQALPRIELEALGEAMEELYDDLMADNLRDDDDDDDDQEEVSASLR